MKSLIASNDMDWMKPLIANDYVGQLESLMLDDVDEFVTTLISRIGDWSLRF